MENRFSNKNLKNGGRTVGPGGRSAPATPIFLIFIGKSIFHFFIFLFFNIFIENPY